MESKEQLFSRLFPFWPTLSQKEQDQILKGSQPAFFPKNTLMRQKEQGCRGLMILLHGQLRTYLVSEEGREVTLYRLQAGEVCVMSSSCLMDALVFDVLIEAMEDTEVLLLPSLVLSPLLPAHPPLELYLYKTASERFSDIMWTIQQILFLGADRRVAIFLWDEFTKKGEVLSFTHEEIARYIGSAREVVTRVLRYFVQEGIVSLSRGRIRILDKEKLRRLV